MQRHDTTVRHAGIAPAAEGARQFVHGVAVHIAGFSRQQVPHDKQAAASTQQQARSNKQVAPNKTAASKPGPPTAGLIYERVRVPGHPAGRRMNRRMRVLHVLCSSPKTGSPQAGLFFAAGSPQGKNAPSGGSDPRSGGAWGPFSFARPAFSSRARGVLLGAARKAGPSGLPPRRSFHDRAFLPPAVTWNGSRRQPGGRQPESAATRPHASSNAASRRWRTKVGVPPPGLWIPPNPPSGIST